MIKEYDKVKLKTGEIARISEVLKENFDYIAEIFKMGGGVEVDQISQSDIKSKFVEYEEPIDESSPTVTKA
jgi:hypothetical protein